MKNNDAYFVLERELEKVSSFDSITDEKKEKIQIEAERLKNDYCNEKNKKEYFEKIVYYLTNVRNRNRRLEIMTVEEKLATLVEIIDPECEMYKIYEENSSIRPMKLLITIKFGFFDLNFIKIEKLYIKRFYNMEDYEFIKKLEL